MKKSLVLSFLISFFAMKNFAQNLTPTTSGYVAVNGLNMHYETYGSGKPLVMLHGAYWSATMCFGHLIPELSKTRQVILFDLQGHGKTADTDRPFSYPAIADDVAKALKQLKIEKADVFGYSFGGTVALQLAIKSPELVNKMVVVSTVFRHSGYLPQLQEVLKSVTPEMFEQTPIKAEYDRLAPDPSHWKAFIRKFAQFDTQDFDLGAENIKHIKAPVLLVMADNDGMDLANKAEMYQLLGGNVFGDMAGVPKSQLAILSGQTHTGLIMEADWFLKKVPAFLDVESQTVAKH